MKSDPETRQAVLPPGLFRRWMRKRSVFLGAAILPAFANYDGKCKWNRFKGASLEESSLNFHNTAKGCGARPLVLIILAWIRGFSNITIMKLTRELILKALTRLGELAFAKGLELHVCIYGGSAMILAYDSRLVSKDVDVIMHPSAEGFALAHQVAEESGLHRDWLNNDVRYFVSETKDREGRRPLNLPIEIKGLKLEVPTANYLLAMKARACREPIPGLSVDEADLRFLIRKMGIRSIEEVETVLEQFFPEDPLRAGSRIIIERIIDEVNHEKKAH